MVRGGLPSDRVATVMRSVSVTGEFFDAARQPRQDVDDEDSGLPPKNIFLSGFCFARFDGA